jgi:hypothetical protein
MKTVYETLPLCRPLFSDDKKFWLGFWVRNDGLLHQYEFWKITIDKLVEANGKLSQEVGECAFNKMKSKQYDKSNYVSDHAIGVIVKFFDPIDLAFETLKLCRPLLSNDEKIWMGFWIRGDHGMLDDYEFWKIAIQEQVDSYSNKRWPQEVGERALDKIKSKQYILSNNISGYPTGKIVRFLDPSILLWKL